MASPFAIELAQGSDWPWIIDGHVETSLETLAPLLRATVDEAVLRKNVSDEISRAAEDDGKTCAVFVAREAKGEAVGFVWVGDRMSQFTSEVRAFLYGVYVARDHRRCGIGKILMKAAEKWAMSRGHQTLVLNVAAHNIPALNMYEKLGFAVDTKTMSKKLGEHPDAPDTAARRW